ncbi:transposase [Methylobacter sp. G7]|uniref:transposase n=1 Tax=Methylobacter sp. G7 TaxID=3230117 RepID=UPI003D80599F
MLVKYILTGGQEAECKRAIPLLENVNASAVLADRAYDTNELREWLECRGLNNHQLKLVGSYNGLKPGYGS